MRSYQSLLLTLLVILQFSCSDEKDIQHALDSLTYAMSGTYENSLQAAVDTNYTNRTMQLCPIWEDSRDSKWLYSEINQVDYPGQPFRQRIYKLKYESAGSFTMDAYMFYDPERFFGKCDSSEMTLDELRDSLVLRERCTMRLVKIGEGHYQSRFMDKKGCTSPRSDIGYITTEIELKDAHFNLWVRGFDYVDQQVYGPVEEGYDFVKTDDM